VLVLVLVPQNEYTNGPPRHAAVVAEAAEVDGSGGGGGGCEQNCEPER